MAKRSVGRARTLAGEALAIAPATDPGRAAASVASAAFTASRVAPVLRRTSMRLPDRPLVLGEPSDSISFLGGPANLLLDAAELALELGCHERPPSAVLQHEVDDSANRSVRGHPLASRASEDAGQ